MSGCGALKEINMESNEQLTAAGLGPFCASPPAQLEKLILAYCKLEGVPAMDGCAVLTEINLAGNKQLTAAGLQPFCASPSPQLEKLILVSCDLEAAPDLYNL